MAGGKQSSSSSLLDRPVAAAIEEERETFTEDGAIATSERRWYDPTHMHNDWYSVGSWLKADGRTWGRRMTSPLGALIAVLAVIAIIGGAVAVTGATSGTNPARGSTASNTAPHDMSGGMSGGSTSADASTTSVPAAAKAFDPDPNHPAKYALDKDGAKHYTFTAQQVMWTPVKGLKPVLAWTLDGTVPGPTIRVTAGDHVRVTINNQFPEATTIHFHGLLIPSSEDGVPGIGQDPIKPGQSFTYDFTVSDENVGTYFYHSHYDDLKQVSGGLYGAFIVDPRPGTPQARQLPAHQREYLQIISELGGYYVINGKSYPDTYAMQVTHGDMVLVRVINLGEMIHPMHLHGHFFDIVAEDGAPLAQPVRKDTLQIAPGESTDFTFYAWAAPGSIYPFHCHILNHVMNPGQSMDEMGGLITAVVYDK